VRRGCSAGPPKWVVTLLPPGEIASESLRGRRPDVAAPSPSVVTPGFGDAVRASLQGPSEERAWQPAPAARGQSLPGSPHDAAPRSRPSWRQRARLPDRAVRDRGRDAVGRGRAARVGSCASVRPDPFGWCRRVRDWVVHAQLDRRTTCAELARSPRSWGWFCRRPW
jgi:hypothetical protein